MKKYFSSKGYCHRAAGYCLLLALLFMPLSGHAQRPSGFDPVRFQADLEQFITSQAALSPQSAAQFFPVYRELRRKQMAIFGEMKRFKHIDTTDDKACEEAIKQRDQLGVEMKKLQQTYHERFLQILPASTVFKILKAEDRFHRQYFGKMQTGKPAF